MYSQYFSLSMRSVVIYAFGLVVLFSVYRLSFGSDVGYIRDNATPVYDHHNVPAKQPPELQATQPPPAAVAVTPTPMPTSPTPVASTREVRIVGLVFFGRRDLVRVLDCYLKRNLRVNGGLFDEVIFPVNTDNKEDLDYLDNELLPSTAQYRKFTAKGELGGSWLGQWSAVNEPDTIYVKIDDDVVFIEDNAIANIVQALIDNPSSLAVSANVVNNPALSWVHFHLGVSEPYWPELEKPSNPSPPSSWRASELPAYKGPADGPEGFMIDGSSAAPFPGHRWLPVGQGDKGKYEDPTKYPASTLTYDAYGPSLNNWAAAAQLHYTFLQHLERNETPRYKFGTWDYHYDRISINFIAVRGGDIMAAYPFPETDDEKFLTVEYARMMGKHVVVAGDAIVVHFAFGPQRYAHDGHGITDTDLLGRYTAYAKEMVCPFPTREEKTSPLLRPEGRRRRRGFGKSR